MFEKLIKNLEKINWNNFDEVFSVNKEILESIFKNRDIIGYFLNNSLKDKKLISLAEHYDFFDKIVLYIDKKDRFRIRLHVFSGENSNQYRPHCHRWDYSSVILNGGYKHNIYGTEKEINENTKIDVLKPVLCQEERIGSIYTLSNKVFHSIAAKKDTVSIIIRGPSLKDRFLIIDKKVNKIWWEYGRESETIEEIRNKVITTRNLKLLVNKVNKLVL